MNWKLKGVIWAVLTLIMIYAVTAGCPEFERPPFSTVSRIGDIQMVTCNETKETWYLTCSNDQWIGEIGQCPQVSGCPTIAPPPFSSVERTGEKLAVACNGAEEWPWYFTCQENMWIGVMGICPGVPGCPDIDPPPFATVTRREDDLIVRCNETKEMWFLTCRDNEWIGEMGNCTREPGCPDIDPPPFATVTRREDDLIVRCIETAETWFLTCRDNEWIGEMGNCTRATDEINEIENQREEMDIHLQIQNETLYKLRLENAEREELNRINLLIKQEEHTFYKLRNDLLRQSLALEERMEYKVGPDGSLFADDD